MNDRLKILITFFVISAILSCENECNDCGPLVSQPLINVDFINQRGINALDTIIIEKEEEIRIQDSINSFWVDSSGVLNDSIEALQMGIDSGNTELTERFNMIETLISSLEPVLQEQEQIVDSLNLVLDSLENNMTNMLNGVLLIEQISSPDLSDTAITFSDSTSDYVLPFPNDTSINEVSYEIIISDLTYGISIPYSNEISVNDRREIGITVYDIDSSKIELIRFDSMTLNCQDSLCISNEASIILYF